MRALLLRFGPRLVSFGCVAGKRSFLGNVCDTPIALDPRIVLDCRYTIDCPAVDVGRALVRFEFFRITPTGSRFATGRHTMGATDMRSPDRSGFATWPLDTFKVTMTAHGEAVVHDGVNHRCLTSPRSPCKDADCATGWRRLGGPRAGLARPRGRAGARD